MCQPRSGFRGSRSREVGGSAVVVEWMGAGQSICLEGRGMGVAIALSWELRAHGQLGKKNIIPAALKLRTRI